MTAGLSDESSDDEPLINLVKKNHAGKQTKTKTKVSTPKKRDTTPKKPRKTLVSGKGDRGINIQILTPTVEAS